jgi:hypothetical protein
MRCNKVLLLLHSCSEDYVGLVLYAKDGATDWRCNGVHCQAGYIYIRKTSVIDHIDSDYGQVRDSHTVSVLET